MLKAIAELRARGDALPPNQAFQRTCLASRGMPSRASALGAAERRRYMAIKVSWLTFAALLMPLSACSAEPVESSFCALVSAQGREPVSQLIALLDTHAAAESLKRGAPSPNGITYAEKEKKYIINVVPVGPRGVEIAFFPREPGTFTSEAQQLERFIFEKVTATFPAVRCEQVKDYGKGKIYGYDRIAI